MYRRLRRQFSVVKFSYNIAHGSQNQQELTLVLFVLPLKKEEFGTKRSVSVSISASHISLALSLPTLAYTTIVASVTGT